MTDSERQKILQARDLLNELLGFGLLAYREGDRIKVESEAEFQELQFEVDGNKVSVQEMLHSGFEPSPPPLPASEYLIGNSANIDKAFTITVGTGSWNGDEFIFTNSETIILPETSDLECKLYGWWDSRYLPDDAPANISKAYPQNFDQVDDPLIPVIGGFEAGDSETSIRQRLEAYKDAIEGRDVDIIILQDEPFYDGLSTQDQERIVRVAKEVLPGYRLAFTFADANVDRDLPDNVDVAGINFYPFFERDYGARFIDSRADFFDEATEVIHSVTSQTDAEILIVAQAFYHPGKYRRPPVESAAWFVDLIQAHSQVIGLLNYRWQYRAGGKHFGLSEMPALYEAQRVAFEGMCGNEN